jgi:probable addiction module antidote protein
MTYETRVFDPANYLHTEEDILHYLQAAMEGNDPGHIASALGDAVRIQGHERNRPDSRRREAGAAPRAF